MKIRRLLIANRGEIAVRIARSAREMGIETVAVYSEADAAAVHVRTCDRAVSIGGAAPSDSYLSISRLIEAARASRADAVHPGYGFLAENAAFATAVDDAGLCWIGPPAAAIAAMGDKREARARMERAGVPVVPGADVPSSAEGLAAAAQRLGYPLLVKAAAGGGGKGIRAVTGAAEFQRAIAAARRESESAFGDATVYLEKLMVRPRHVEFQIFADRRGTTVHLNERECSIQRRHQKIVEETPSPALDPQLRARMGEAAISAAKAVSYVGAGTIEFLLAPDRRFYFLEANTRLQVEHPVTEEVLGLDLVRAQIRVAEGRALPERWRRLVPVGAALECRVYAEDPETFLPRSGEVLSYEEPRGPGIRVDSGIEGGTRVSIDYDPILAKVVTRGPTREVAISRMRRALREYVILGVGTNLSLLRRVVESQEFADGNLDTEWLGRLAAPRPEPVPEAAIAAAGLMTLNGGAAKSAARLEAADPWLRSDGWRPIR
jgi:acetyl-CoA carboxylase biotin carboxylase subunit